MNPSVVAWLLLGASALVEVAGTVALKRSDGFVRLLPSALAGCCFVLAVWLMSVAMRRLEMGVAYAAWAGGSAVITALVGISLDGESGSAWKLAGLALVVAGIVVLHADPR